MKTNGQLMEELLTNVISEGEYAYQANRDAVQEFDVFLDDEEGVFSTNAMIDGIGDFITGLEGMKNVMDGIKRKLRSSIR